jgi:hypothetical protein
VSDEHAFIDALPATRGQLRTDHRVGDAEGGRLHSRESAVLISREVDPAASLCRMHATTIVGRSLSSAAFT